MATKPIIGRNNRKALPIPVVPRTMQITNADGTVTRSGMLLLEQLQDIAAAIAPGPAPEPGGPVAQLYWRTLDINDSTVGNNIAPNVAVQAGGIGNEITGILRLAITADLVVRVNLGGTPLGTLTIPLATPVQTEVSIPITTAIFVEGDPITFDITGSDGQIDKDGVATVTVEWAGPAPDVGVTGRHGFGASFSGGGSVLVAGLTAYVTVPVGGTISAWNLLLDAGTCTITVWKLARGTAIPTVADSISTSGLSISTGTAIHSTVVTDFTTLTVTDGDIVAVHLQACAGAGEINFSVEF